MRHLRLLCGAIFGLAGLLVGISAWAQSPPAVRFPTPVAQAPPPIITSPPPGVWSSPPPVVGAPYGTVPPFGAVAPPVYAPGLDPRFSQGPSALVPAWPAPASPYCEPTPAMTWEGTWKLISGASLEHTWLPGEGGSDVDINDTNVSVTAALPIFPNPNNPLLLSPRIRPASLVGPVTTAPDPGMADLPGQAYSAFLDCTWRPQFNEMLAFEVGVRPGVYSDFETFNTDSFRLQGRGVAYLRVTPTLQIAAGAAYLDRLDIKLMPVGGVIWTPHERAKYEFIFPKPKLARYCFTSWSNTEWWGYLTAEYGGGSWTIERAAGFDDQIDINDIRVALGIEFKPAPAIDGTRVFGRGFVAYVETGYVFEREILYRSGMPAEFEVPETFMLRAGMRF